MKRSFSRSERCATVRRRQLGDGGIHYRVDAIRRDHVAIAERLHTHAERARPRDEHFDTRKHRIIELKRAQIWADAEKPFGFFTKRPPRAFDHVETEAGACEVGEKPDLTPAFQRRKQAGIDRTQDGADATASALSSRIVRGRGSASVFHAGCPK